MSLFLVSGFGGYVLGKNYSNREKFYNELMIFCNMLIANIRFNKNKLNVICEDYANSCSNDMGEYIYNYLNNSMTDISFISKYENKKIKDFFDGLGNFDSNSEIGYIENYKIYFNECYKKSVEENKKYGTLYSKLGLILGLVLVILFI